MKTGLILAATAGMTSAANFHSNTWCGPHNGMVTDEYECAGDAKRLGFSYGGVAGNDWHAGCVINDGAVYFVSMSPDGTHSRAVNGGYVCMQSVVSVESKTLCGPKEMIKTEMACRDAASQAHLTFVANAGSNWNAGCIHHKGGGGVYFVAYDAAGIHSDIPDAGYLCHHSKMIEPEIKPKMLERCAPQGCADWTCDQWCACFDVADEPMYNKAGCITTDDDDSCQCKE